MNSPWEPRRTKIKSWEVACNMTLERRGHCSKAEVRRFLCPPRLTPPRQASHLSVCHSPPGPSQGFYNETRARCPGVRWSIGTAKEGHLVLCLRPWFKQSREMGGRAQRCPSWGWGAPKKSRTGQQSYAFLGTVPPPSPVRSPGIVATGSQPSPGPGLLAASPRAFPSIPFLPSLQPIRGITAPPHPNPRAPFLPHCLGFL